MQRLLLFLGFMAAGSGAIYLLIVIEQPPRALRPPELPSNVLAMKGVTIRQHEGEVLRYELLATEALYNERTARTELTEVNFLVFETLASGARGVALRGRSAKALMERDEASVVLMGQVRLVDKDGTEIRSERLEYLDREGKVVSPGEVWVSVKDVIHEGGSLVYTIPDRTMTFTRPVFYQ